MLVIHNVLVLPFVGRDFRDVSLQSSARIQHLELILHVSFSMRCPKSVMKAQADRPQRFAYPATGEGSTVDKPNEQRIQKDDHLKL